MALPTSTVSQCATRKGGNTMHAPLDIPKDNMTQKAAPYLF